MASSLSSKHSVVVIQAFCVQIHLKHQPVHISVLVNLTNLSFRCWYLSTTHSLTHLETDGTDVIVLLQLVGCGSGEGVDLLSCFLSEQEAPPARLSTQPHVEVGVDDDDGSAHPAPFTKQGLPGSVGHHTERHQELEHPADGVDPVDHLVQAFDRVGAEQFHHEERVDQHSACNLGEANLFMDTGGPQQSDAALTISEPEN